MTNQDYKNGALAALKGNWAPAVLATVIVMLITCAVSMSQLLLGSVAAEHSLISTLIFYALNFLLVTPLQVGVLNGFLALYDSGDNRITANMFSMGFGNYVHVILTMLVYYAILILGFICFIIPGLIFMYMYAMVPYLLVEEPELSIIETLRKSRTMMKGHKFDFFFLQLSFIGWAFLSILTLGIGGFWFMPYYYTACAAFWADIRESNKAELA